MLNRLFRAFMERRTGSPCDDDIYVANPEAEEFSLEDLIATFDDLSASDSELSDA